MTSKVQKLRETRSKVCSLGNRQEALRRLAHYSPADIRTFLVPEPENQYDPQAVAVMVGIQGGKGLFHLGYVPRTLTPVVLALGGQLPAFRVVSSKTTFGARVSVSL